MPHAMKHLQKRWPTQIWAFHLTSHATVPLNLAFPDHLIFLDKPTASASLFYIFLIDWYTLISEPRFSWFADWTLTCRRGGLCAADGPALQHTHQQPGPSPPSPQGMLTMHTWLSKRCDFPSWLWKRGDFPFPDCVRGVTSPFLTV